MENNAVHCYRNRLKSRGYTDIHISKLDSGQEYFVECIYYGNAICAVVLLSQMMLGLSVVPIQIQKTVNSN